MATIPAYYNNNSINSLNSENQNNIENNSALTQNVVCGPKLQYVQNRSVGSYIFERLHSHGQQIAQIDPLTGDFTTFQDIKFLSLKLAKGLRNIGIGHGDVISICSNNNLDVCLPMLAALYVGAIVSPLHSSLCRPDFKHLLAITKPKIIFCDYSSIEIIRKSLAELKLSVDLIIFGDSKIHQSLEGFLNSHCETGDDITPFDCTDPWKQAAFIVPTNGTKDLPRGVMITHGNILHHLQSHWDTDWSNLSMLSTSTMFSITGIKSVLACFDHGNIGILAPEFDPNAIAKIIHDWKGDLVLVLSSIQLSKIVNYSKINDYNLERCKIIITYGSKLSDVHYKLTESLFNTAILLVGYGSVETTGIVTTPTTKKLSVGIPDPDTEMKIIDPESGRTLGPNQPGELYIRGKRIMFGYYEDQLSTCEAIDKDGWYHTGDIGYFDADQCLFIEGSLSDKFSYKNCEVMPFEIENILLGHFEIKEACVIGVRHKLDGARAKAFIVRHENSTISETRIKKYLEGNLSPFKQLHGGIVFMEKLPYTPTGKINRRKLMKLP